MNWVSASDPVGFEQQTVTPDQAFAIFDTIKDELVRCLVVLIAATGMRFREALGLRWSDVRSDMQDVMIRRRFADGEMNQPKSLASRAPVEMTPQLAEVLKLWRRESNYAKEDDLIFASETMRGKQPRTGCTISQKYIRPAAERLGIIQPDSPRFGMHALRHSLATFLAEQGTEPEVIQRILRHSTLPMTMRYTHLRKLSRAAQIAFLKKFTNGNDDGNAG